MLLQLPNGCGTQTTAVRSRNLCIPRCNMRSSNKLRLRVGSWALYDSHANRAVCGSVYGVALRRGKSRPRTSTDFLSCKPYDRALVRCSGMQRANRSGPPERQPALKMVCLRDRTVEAAEEAGHCEQRSRNGSDEARDRTEKRRAQLLRIAWFYAGF